MNRPQQIGISQAPLGLLSSFELLSFFFFFKPTFFETLITVEGCCKAGREIDHFYLVVCEKNVSLGNKSSHLERKEE